MDLLALLPFDYFVVWIATRHGGGMSDTALNYFQLFRLLRMVGSRPDISACVKWAEVLPLLIIVVRT